MQWRDCCLLVNYCLEGGGLVCCTDTTLTTLFSKQRKPLPRGPQSLVHQRSRLAENLEWTITLQGSKPAGRYTYSDNMDGLSARKLQLLAKSR